MIRFYNCVAKSLAYQFGSLLPVPSSNGRRKATTWILLYRRRRMGRVVPDPANPGMYRSLKFGDFSDISNLSWAKDAVLAQAIREVAYELANDPSKCPVKRGSKKAISSPARFSEAAE